MHSLNHHLHDLFIMSVILHFHCPASQWIFIRHSLNFSFFVQPHFARVQFVYCIFCTYSLQSFSGLSLAAQFSASYTICNTALYVHYLLPFICIFLSRALTLLRGHHSLYISSSTSPRTHLQRRTGDHCFILND